MKHYANNFFLIRRIQKYRHIALHVRAYKYEDAFYILHALDTTVLALQKVRVSHGCVVVVAAGKQHTEAGRQVCGAPLNS